MLRAESRSGSGRDHRVLARGGRPVGGVVSHGRVRRAGGYNMTAYTCRARSDFRISSRPPEALPARARSLAVHLHPSNRRSPSPTPQDPSPRRRRRRRRSNARVACTYPVSLSRTLSRADANASTAADVVGEFFIM